jgi:TonB family protein
MKTVILFFVCSLMSHVLCAENILPSDTTKKVCKTRKKSKKAKKDNVVQATPTPTVSQEPTHIHPPPLPLAPQYKGGDAAMKEFIAKNLVYPDAAKTRDVNNKKVVVSFVVTKTGKLKDFKILESVGYGCDEEALRIVKMMPDWEPGKIGREYLDMPFSVSIPFNRP